MSTRKYPSGYEKLKKKRQREELIESQKGAMEKFIISKKQNLVEVLKVLKEVLQINENSPINVLNYIKRLESFPNACIAFKILLTIPVTVASAERSFSKLKLIKSYLRSTMSQKRLRGLTILSIEKEMLVELECKNLISNFASQKTRKINFNWKKIWIYN